jgi:sulfonate transport system substrate-binding protein
VFVETGDVKSQEDIDEALDTLFDPSLVEKADPASIGSDS